jgi:hypothetical protein
VCLSVAEELVVMDDDEKSNLIMKLQKELEGVSFCGPAGSCVVI